MSAHYTEEHGTAVLIASNQIGTVTLCPCGVLTLNMSCVSVRLELAALRELGELVNGALQQLSGGASTAEVGDAPVPTASKSSSVH